MYFLAEEEGWDRQKVMGYFNDKQAFEKFYNNVSIRNKDSIDLLTYYMYYCTCDLNALAVNLFDLCTCSGKRSSSVSKIQSQGASSDS